jgi:coproporphyrinogen III oxidase-like Fe-S oxidoreductase
MDDAVQRAHDRPFFMTRFSSAVERLSHLAQLEMPIIMGLPGDTPEGFRRTLKFAMSLPVRSVRAYHCLVLPDGLLTRSRPEWAIELERDTLAMIANRDWSASAITAMRHELTDQAHRTDGSAGAYWWLLRR